MVLCVICGSGRYCHYHDENQPTAEQRAARQAEDRQLVAEWERILEGMEG